jgi:hypothetical protein
MITSTHWWVEVKNVVNSQNRRTLGEIAKMAGVGHITAEQYDAIQQKGTSEQKKAVSLAPIPVLRKSTAKSAGKNV